MWTTISGASVLLVGGLVWSIGCSVVDLHDDYRAYWAFNDAGLNLVCIGGASAISGAIVWSVGVGMKNNAYKVYNQHCAESLTLNLQYTDNGLGLALNF